MTRDELKEIYTLEDEAVFLNPAETFDKGIIGVSADSLHIIYDYEKLVESFVEKGSTEEEAREDLDFNTLRSIPYMGAGYPIVMFPAEDN